MGPKSLVLNVAKVNVFKNTTVAQIPLTVLNKRRVIQVDGPLGKTTIEVVGQRARVIDSPCRDKVCIHFGWVQNSGDFAACLPNRVMITVDKA